MMRMGRRCAYTECSLIHTHSLTIWTNSYHAEPSGTFYRYDAKAIGSGSEGAQAELQNSYHKSLTLPEAEELVLRTLKQVMEEKLDAKNVQLASVTKDKGFRVYDDEEMKACVQRIEGEN
jgi:20S proteasome subunit alpha 5